MIGYSEEVKLHETGGCIQDVNSNAGQDILSDAALDSIDYR